MAFNDFNDFSDIMGMDDEMLGFNLKKALQKAGNKMLPGNPFGKSGGGPRKPAMLPNASDGVMQRVPLGTGVATWAGGTAANTVVRLTVRPQMPFSIRKVVFIPTRSAGAAAVGINVIDIQVAQQSIFGGGGQLPIDMFSPDAVDSGVLSVTAQIGQDILIDLVNLAAVPAAPDFVSVTGGFYGDAVSMR